MNKGKNFKIIIGGCCLLLLGACGKVNYTPDENTTGASTLASTTQSQIKVNMKVYDNTNAMIYSDADINSSLVLRANQNYKLSLSPSQDVAGLSYSLLLTKTSVVGSSPQTIPLQSGDNNFSVATQGDYSLKLVASAPKMLPLTKYYTANVTCQNPTFAATSLDGSKMSVSGSSNLYNFSAASVASSANGMGPYTCAWDGTGVGIVDTAFKDCASSSGTFYSNLVGDRNISVLVKDACNTVHKVSKVMNLPFTVPATGSAVVFIHGQVNSASGSAVDDSRVDKAKYLALNAGGNNIVQSSYSGSAFTISAAKSYGMASSVPYGMKIQLSNLTGSVNLASMSSTLSAASAKIKSISYSTDQAGDAQAAASFSGASCTLSNQNVKVTFVQGTPCSDGSASGNKATVEVWGNYTCTSLSNATGAISISGSFDGLDTMVDSCIGGGGGGGGGGVTPINL